MNITLNSEQQAALDIIKDKRKNIDIKNWLGILKREYKRCGDNIINTLT